VSLLHAALLVSVQCIRCGRGVTIIIKSIKAYTYGFFYESASICVRYVEEIYA